MADAGWYRDPTGQADGRYWDGQRWADQVNTNGVTATSPMDPAQAETPPPPGSEFVAPPPQQTQPVVQQPAKSSHVGAVLGGLAVVIAVVALIVVVVNNNDDEGDTEQQDGPSVTIELGDDEGPGTTEAPAEEGG